jgi:hypothetical protein
MERDQSLYELVLDFHTDIEADVQRQLNPLGVDALLEVTMLGGMTSVVTTSVYFRGPRQELMDLAIRYGMAPKEFDQACALVVRASRLSNGRDED